MKTDRFNLRKLSRFLISIFVYGIMLILVSVVGNIMLDNITLVIIEVSAVRQNSDSILKIVGNNAPLVIIILAGIWLIIASILSLDIVWSWLTTWRESTNPNDTP